MKEKPGKDLVRYEVIIQEDEETGDLILPLPPPILASLGWKEGDDLSFSVDDDGNIYIQKA